MRISLAEDRLVLRMVMWMGDVDRCGAAARATAPHPRFYLVVLVMVVLVVFVVRVLR